MTKSKKLFEENFTGLLKSLGIQNFDSVSFIVVPTTELENYTNWEEHKISIEEIKESIGRILMNYRFYPPKPNHQKPVDTNYSQLVINKDFKNSAYSICEAENLENEIQSKLNMTDAINYYSKHQIGNEFCGIEVKY